MQLISIRVIKIGWRCD